MGYWDDFYRSVGIGAPTPAPVAQTPMSVEDIYRGIYPAANPGLTTRSVSAVPVPLPRAPLSIAMSGKAGLGTGVDRSGSMSLRAPMPNQPAGSINVAKDTTRLPMSAVGYADLPRVPGAVAAIERAAPSGLQFPKLGGGALPAYAASPRLAPSYSTAHNLNYEPKGTEGQEIADSMGLPVKTPSGKVYQPKTPGSALMPSGRAATRVPSGNVSATMGNGPRRGLFGSLFAGGAPQARSSGGGGPITRAPLAGSPILVDPGTQAGSTLESMGFSSGALLPAAVSQNLSKRGYI